MGVVSGSTKAPSRRSGRAPQILAPVGLDDKPALLPEPEANRLTALLDRLAGEVVLRHAIGRRVLDLGRGAPRITEWVGGRVDRLTVLDAVDLGRRETVHIPLPDQSFDMIYSLRTLPHLGHDASSSASALGSVLDEVGRLLIPGGVAVLELDNARSPLGLYHLVRQPGSLGDRGPLVVDSPRGLTRFDTLGRFLKHLPASLTPVELHGLRLAIASAHVLSIPVVGRILTRLEWYGRDQPLLRRFGAHLLLVLRRLTPPRIPSSA